MYGIKKEEENIKNVQDQQVMILYDIKYQQHLVDDDLVLISEPIHSSKTSKKYGEK